MHEVDGPDSGGALPPLLPIPPLAYLLSSRTLPGGPARAVAHWAGSGNDEGEPGGSKSAAAIFWLKLGFAHLRLVALSPSRGFKNPPTTL